MRSPLWRRAIPDVTAIVMQHIACGDQFVMDPQPPTEDQNYFTCPHCGTLTDQKRQLLYSEYFDERKVRSYSVYQAITVRVCGRCRNNCVWNQGKLLHPLDASLAIPPNPDLPDNVRTDVDEARLVYSLSPRSAAALLRLALEKLCLHLGAEGRDLNTQIGWMVRERRLDPMVQKALDIVRVVGNEAVHPGTLDLRDKPHDVAVLFRMVNEIAEELITRPKRVLQAYERLPVSKREGIEQRDASEH